MPKPLQKHNIQAIYQIYQPYLFIVLFVHFIHPLFLRQLVCISYQEIGRLFDLPCLSSRVAFTYQTSWLPDLFFTAVK